MTLSWACWQREILRTEVKCRIATTGDGPTAVTDDQLDLGFSNFLGFFFFLPRGLRMDQTRFWTKDPDLGNNFFQHGLAQKDRWIIQASVQIQNSSLIDICR